MLRLAFGLALTLTLASAASADVYRFVDSKGNVQYTDKPALLPAEKLAVQSRATDATEVDAGAATERARTTAADTARQQAAAARADQNKANQITATAKAEQCVKARERNEAYSTSKRLYETLPDGERRYLTDAELDEARAQAEKAVAEACN
jgi:Domain of unknown function (DUF4124)